MTKQKKQKVDPLIELQTKYQNIEYIIIDVSNIDQLKLKTELIKHHFSVTKLTNDDHQLYVVFDRLNNKNLKQSLQTLKCNIMYFGTDDLYTNQNIKGYSTVPGFHSYDDHRLRYNISTNMCLEYFKDFQLSE